MPVETLSDLLQEELKDLLSAENQLVKALPKAAKAASAQELKDAVMEHLEETKTHIERLNQCFEHLGVNPRAKKCKAMEGLLEEGKELMEEEMDPHIMDQALIGGAQKIEHYEISAYGTARTLAQRLGEEEIAQLLQETLDEEAACDEKLTQIAESLEIPEEGEEQEDETEASGAEEEGDDEEVMSGRSGKGNRGRGGNRGRR